MKNRRRVVGMTLTELIVAIAIMGIAIAGIAELTFVTGAWSTRFANKLDQVSAAQLFLQQFSQDVRMSCNIGDYFGDSSVYGVGFSTFPAVGRNPLYGAGQTPPGDPPGWPEPSYVISPQTLVLQIPILDKNGVPTALKPGMPGLNPQISRGTVNVDTVVYRVVPESQKNDGRYMIQRITFLGVHDSSVPGSEDIPVARMNPPKTILTGVIGPLDKTTGTGPPMVFQYLADLTTDEKPVDNFKERDLGLIYGAVANVELKRETSAQKEPVINGFRAEALCRNRRIHDQAQF